MRRRTEWGCGAWAVHHLGPPRACSAAASSPIDACNRRPRMRPVPTRRPNLIPDVTIEGSFKPLRAESDRRACRKGRAAPQNHPLPMATGCPPRGDMGMGTSTSTQLRLLAPGSCQQTGVATLGGASCRPAHAVDRTHGIEKGPKPRTIPGGPAGCTRAPFPRGRVAHQPLGSRSATELLWTPRLGGVREPAARLFEIVPTFALRKPHFGVLFWALLYAVRTEIHARERKREPFFCLPRLPGRRGSALHASDLTACRFYGGCCTMKKSSHAVCDDNASSGPQGPRDPNRLQPRERGPIDGRSPSVWPRPVGASDF